MGHKILLVGGGTAGHSEPLFVVGHALRERGHTVALVSNPTEATRTRAAAEKIEFFPINAGKLRRYFSAHTALEPLKLAKGYLQARRILAMFKPDCIFSKGGYVSVPLILAASSGRARVPIVLHESDTVLGLANRLVARRATKILLGFGLTRASKLNTQIVGIPIDPLYRLNPVREHHPLILILGGSQGSRALNALIFSIAADLAGLADVVHQTGTHDYARAQLVQARLPHALRHKYTPVLFSDKLSVLMRRAWVYVGRAGATTLTEIAATRLPPILIPLPSAAGNHQMENARLFERSQAGYVLREQELTPAQLAATIRYLIENKAVRSALAGRLKDLDHPHALEDTVRAIEEVC
jgi:UDP-N-acetylglucosamine--N-acetylmuramyl-(pentapeptide) pyrophosphoryl-undecaprenol N-acetylglucosamine transferase